MQYWRIVTAITGVTLEENLSGAIRIFFTSLPKEELTFCEYVGSEIQSQVLGLTVAGFNHHARSAPHFRITSSSNGGNSAGVRGRIADNLRNSSNKLSVKFLVKFC